MFYLTRPRSLLVTDLAQYASTRANEEMNHYSGIYNEKSFASFAESYQVLRNTYLLVSESNLMLADAVSGKSTQG